MPDYKRMYFSLLKDRIAMMEEMQAAMERAEEIFIESDRDNLIVLPPQKTDEEVPPLLNLRDS